MGLFDLLTFKKEGQKIFTKENFLGLLDLAKREIVKQKDFVEKKGAEKKAAVDKIPTEKINEIKSGCSNKYIKWLLDLIIAGVPKLTQFVYDCLKEKVENL